MYLMDNEKFRIIALDDDRFIHHMLADIISSDYELKSVRTVKEFILEVENFNPSMILLDLTLPDGNGVDICKNLRKNSRYEETFILILTGSTDKKIIEECYEAGADDFIRKPFIPFEIKSKVLIFERILRSRSNLNISLNNQVDLNKKLFWLGEFIHNNLSLTDLNKNFETASKITEIIDVAYFELILKRGSRFISSIKKRYNNISPVRSFDELNEKHNITERLKKNLQMLKIKTGDEIIHICIIKIEHRNEFFAYMLLEKNKVFTAEEKEILFLFAEFISIMNIRFMIENEIKGKNIQYKDEITKIRKIQSLIIPEFSDIPGYDIAFAYLPAQDLSGDFFDAYYIDEDTYQIILCDVSGHGIASSYVGNQIRINFRIASRKGESPALIAHNVNRALARDLKGSYYYCTAIICQVNIKTGLIKYLSAGHPESMLYSHSNNNCRKIKFTGPLIGLFDDNRYDEIELEMNRGDSLFLYTDGLTESSNLDSKEMFGKVRLENVFTENNEFTSQDIIHSAAGAMYEFTDYCEQNDDITMICIKKN